MNVDWSLVISLLTVVGMLLAGFTDRKKVYSDINTQILENVKKSIQIREDDIKYREKLLTECIIEKRHQADYAQYLWEWIDRHVRTKSRPKTFEKFKIRRASG